MVREGPSAAKGLEDRLWSRVERGAGCWLWSGPVEGRGFGVVWWEGRSDRAHRVAWRLTHGDPGTARVVQTCGNRRCCRPDHLELRPLRTETARAGETVGHGQRTRPVGHLERRGEESWRLVAYRGRDPATGARRYERRVFRGTESEARAALQRFVDVGGGGVGGAPEGVTLGAVLERYAALRRAGARRGGALRTIPEDLRDLPLARVRQGHLMELARYVWPNPPQR